MMRKLDVLYPGLSGFLTAVLLLTGACTQLEDVPAPETEPTAVPLRIRPASANTLTGSLQLLVFDSRGTQPVNTYYRSDGYSGAFDGTLTVTSGIKTIAAVLRGPDLSAVSDYPGLEEWTYELGSDNPDAAPLLFASHIVMVDEGMPPVELAVGRQVGQVTVLNIYNRLCGRQEIRRLYLYLANASAEAALGRDCLAAPLRVHPDGHTGTAAATDDSWASRPLLDGTEGRCAAIRETATGNISLSYGASTGALPALYSCPTPAGWQPWLVIAAEIEGTVYYYNIRLSPFRKDVSQQFSLTLRTLGSEAPCVDNDSGTFDMTASVVDWTRQDGDVNI